MLPIVVHVLDIFKMMKLNFGLFFALHPPTLMSIYLIRKTEHLFDCVWYSR